jgi:predicted lactoylglutathione lyase
MYMLNPTDQIRTSPLHPINTHIELICLSPNCLRITNPQTKPAHPTINRSTMAPKKQVFINLATTSIPASTAFANALGLTYKSDWSCDGSNRSAFFEYDSNFYLCYHDQPTFSTWLFPGRKISDSTSTTEALVTFSAGSREEVDSLIAKGVEAGGKQGPNMVPDAEKYGMYSRSVEDPDGHVFEIIYCEEKPKDGQEGKEGNEDEKEK